MATTIDRAGASLIQQHGDRASKPSDGSQRPTPPVHRFHRSLFTVLEGRERRVLWSIFGIALLLRLAFLENVPDTVTADELDFAGDALRILHGTGPGFFGLDWTQLPAPSIYLFSWSWQLFGATIFAERLVSALLTALAIFPFYALLRRVVAPITAFAATTLFAASRWYLHFSRSGWTNGHVVLYMLLAAWLLTRALEHGRWRDWCGFGGALALLLYGYSSGRVVILACLIPVLIVLWERRYVSGAHGWRRIILGGLVAGCIGALLFAPELVTISRNIAFFNQRTSAVLIFNDPGAAQQPLPALLARQSWTAIHSFILMDRAMGEGRYKGPEQAWLDPISALLYIGGLLLSLRRGRAALLWWSLLLIPLVLTQVLTNNIPDGARGLTMVAPMYFFVALALDALFTHRWAARPSIQCLLACCVVGIVALNIWEYGSWMALPQARAVREPAVSTESFYLWRDFQISRLNAHQGIMSADEYNALPAATIAARVADTAIAARKDTDDLPALPQMSLRALGTVAMPVDATAQVSRPNAVAIDREGNLYVADSLHDTIARFTPDGHFVNAWRLTVAKGHPASIVAADDGTILVLVAEEGTITRYDPQGIDLGLVSNLGGPTIARGMGLGLEGNLYVAATGTSTLFKLSSHETGATSTADERLHPELTYTQPTAIVAERDGAFIIYEPDSRQLRGFTADGQLHFRQPAPQADTINAGNLTLTSDGGILLADPIGRRLLFFASDGTPRGQFPIPGVPQGLAIAPSGNIAVTDTENHCVHIYAFGDQP